MTTSITFEPPLPPERITLQRNMFMGTVYKAVAGSSETPFWRARGDAECMLLGNPTLQSSIPRRAGPGHLCMLVGGPQARALDDLDTDGRRAVLLRQLAQHHGHAVEQPASWHEKAWHQDTFAGGGYSALPVQGTSEGFYPVASVPTAGFTGPERRRPPNTPATSKGPSRPAFAQRGRLPRRSRMNPRRKRIDRRVL